MMIDRKQMHKGETRRQILLPGVLLLLVFCGFLAGMFYLGKHHPVGVNMAADYLTAIVFTFLILLNLAGFFLTVFFISLTSDWIKTLPNHTDKANSRIEAFGPKVEAFLNKMTDPLITVESKFKAVMEILFRKKD